MKMVLLRKKIVNLFASASNFSASTYQRVSKKAAEVIFNSGIICHVCCCHCTNRKSEVMQNFLAVWNKYKAQAVSFVKIISSVKSSLVTWVLEVGDITLGLAPLLLKFKLEADCQEIQSSLHYAYVHMTLLSVSSTFAVDFQNKSVFFLSLGAYPPATTLGLTQWVTTHRTKILF